MNPHSALKWCLPFLLLIPSWSDAQMKRRDRAKEMQIENRLRSLAPEEVERFREATQALDRYELANAETLFQLVLQRVPEFDPAIGRLGLIFVRTARVQEGIALGEKAVTINRSPDNVFNLAMC